MASQRQKIIESVFSKRNASGSLEETYVSHIKIWEDAGPEGGGRKPRYILLSQASNGSGFIHKSKLNTNGSFSVGKTWKLSELRAINVISPSVFTVTLARTYKWQTEDQNDQHNFLEATIRLFNDVTGGSTLQVDGFQYEADASKQPAPPQFDHVENNLQIPLSSSHSQNRFATSEASSPVSTLRELSTGHSRTGSSSFARPPSVTVAQQPPAPLMPRQRRPSTIEPTSGLVPAANSLTTVQSPVVDNSSIQTTQNIVDTANFSKVKSRDLSPPPPRSRTISARTANAPTIPESLPPRRDQSARISFFDLTNQVTLDRLLNSGGDDTNQLDIETEEGDAQVTLSSVEEMIEGYEWTGEGILGKNSRRGAVDLIEARLLDELMALDKANIHSFLESDDRVGLVMKYMDDAIAELDNMDGLISTYNIHLNAVNDDISYIQSQNRGLQVQNQNQRALLNELENLFQTVDVNQDTLVTLTQESLEKSQSIQRLEESATELYKALQAGRDSDMAATMERLQEYQTHNSQFCKRIFDFLSIMFTAQSRLLLGDNSGIEVPKRGRPSIKQHQDIEAYLGRYSGLMLYLREMDQTIFGRLCAAYFSAASELHGTQIKALFKLYNPMVKRSSEEEHEQGSNASSSISISKGANSMRRAGTLIRSPIENRNKDKEKHNDGDLRASEVFGLILEQITPLIYQEDEFIADFLQINDAALTFADYMGLDNYFRRQAGRSLALNAATSKLVRGAMDLIFGFLPAEMKVWVDNMLQKDNMEIFGIIAILERFQTEAEERGSQYITSLLNKQISRCKGVFERHINEQLKKIEQTKLTIKKRKGVAHFIKNFPSYVAKVEHQLVGADGLEIRTSVDSAYEKIVHTMFDSLKQMAKMEGEDEDKGHLNYHVILLENMHYFVAELSKMESNSISIFSRRAEAIYDENLNAYIKIVIRRPFGKLIDFVEGVDQLLKNTTPADIAKNSMYNKSSLKKTIKEFTAKDIRKHVDALFKRVEKHFTEASGETTTGEGGVIVAGTVLVGVWKACEEEFMKLSDHFSSQIVQCYRDAGVSVEYTTADVESAFRRQRIGS